MKSRHLLFVMLSLAAAIGFWCWARTPVWQVDGLEYAYHAGHFEKEGELLSLVARDHKANWYLETRDVQTGRMLMEVKLDLPSSGGVVECLRNNTRSTSTFTPFVAYEYKMEGNMMNRIGWLFDARTGSRLKTIPSLPITIPDEVYRGDQVALHTETELLLFDAQHPEGRALPLAGIRKARIANDGNYLAVASNAGLLIVDWKSGKKLNEVVVDVMNMAQTLSVANDNTIVVETVDHKGKFTISRRRWDGKELVACCPDISFPADSTFNLPLGILVMREMNQGRLAIASHGGALWPSSYRSLFEWLTDKGIDMKKWVPQKMHLVWHVLDSQNQEISRYEEAATVPLPVNSRLAIEYPDHVKRTSSLIMWNTMPKWPNALAVGIITYLFLYVWSHRKTSAGSSHG